MDGHGDLPALDPIEQRVIGSLLEKERTVPASYPMTLNALRTACNQSSSREPVVDYDDATIVDAIDRLKARGLARMVHASHGSRTVKYRQVLDERLQLEPAELAVITVLLLRGPNAAGELKTRTERLHGFADRAEVEACLARLAAHEPPLVRELERRPGQQDSRWIHLLGPVDLPGPAAGGRGGAGAAAGVPCAATEVVLADGPEARTEKVRAAYDALAGAYADALVDELDQKPFDRWLLERVAALADGGPVADAGCGPGHVAFHLAMAGAEVTGFDLSPGMVEEARRRFGELRFEVGDLTALPPPDGGGGWAAITAWYSLVHLAASELRPAVALLAASLRPGGWLAIGLHLGDEARPVTELFGREVDVTFTLHHPDRVIEAVTTAGLVEIEWYRRSPIPGAEVETERMYVLARRPT
jgi:uncharacterized protein YceH (UPF0502 family)/SAM-dependent methyltransferase